ncbi:MAG: hypothetical protein IPF54_23495 [Draconibacterium sp.]|nr:hypothetical protein [Draconibacterium sp.]
MMKISVTILLIFIGFPNALKGQSAGFFDYVNFRITPLTLINTTESDISPVIVKGDLFFSSVREEFFGNEMRDEQNTSFYDIYRTKINEKGSPLNPRSWFPDLVTFFMKVPRRIVKLPVSCS